MEYRSQALLIVFGVFVLALMTYLIFCLCRRYCNCACVCSCFGYSRNRNNYEMIYDSQKERSYGQDTCRVCLEEMEITDGLFRLPCRHKFHRKCLEQWLCKCNRCPLCKSRVSLPVLAEKPTTAGTSMTIATLLYV